MSTPPNNGFRDLKKIIGWILLCMGIVFVVGGGIMFPVIKYIQNTFQNPYEKYDFAAIREKGTETKAVVIEVRVMKNVEVNGDHPMRIVYEYPDSTRAFTDTFQSMELEKVMKIREGDTIDIQTYHGQSIVKDMKPFRFPYVVFYIAPGLFIVLGLFFFIVGMFLKRKPKPTPIP